MTSLLIAISLLGQSIAGTSDAVRLQSLMRVERQKVDRGIFEVQSEGWTTSVEKRSDYRFKIVTIIDGESIRSDIRDLLHDPDHIDIHSWGPRIVVSYTDRPSSDGRVPAPSVTDLSISRKVGPRSGYIVDPRVLGTCPTTAMMAGRTSLEAEFGNLGNWPVQEVVDDVLDGKPCRKIALSNRKGAQKTVWIDPARDHSVLRVLTTLDNGTKWDLRTKLSYIGSAGRWFPESFDLSQVNNGQLAGQEHATIKVVSMNQPIDPKSFELISMNIPPGTVVVVSSTKPVPGGTQWDGKEIVPLDPRGSPSTMTGRTNRPLLLTLAMASAAVAAALVWRMLGRKRSVA